MQRFPTNFNLKKEPNSWTFQSWHAIFHLTTNRVNSANVLMTFDLVFEKRYRLCQIKIDEVLLLITNSEVLQSTTFCHCRYAWKKKKKNRERRISFFIILGQLRKSAKLYWISTTTNYSEQTFNMKQYTSTRCEIFVVGNSFWIVSNAGFW